MPEFRNLLKNIASDYILFSIMLLIGIVITPITIQILGAATFGLWATIRSLLDYVGILDGGLSNAVPRFVASNKSKSGKEVSQIVSTSFFLYSLISLGVIVIAMILTRYLGILINLEAISSQQAAVVLIIAAITLSLRLLANPFSGVIFGYGRLYIVNTIQVVFFIIQGTSTVLALFAGFNLVGVALASLISTVILNILYAMYVSKAMPEIKVKTKNIEASALRKLLGFSGFMVMNILFMRLIFSTDNLVIGHYVGVSAVASFAIAFQLIDLSRQVVLRVGRSLIPIYSENEVGGKKDLSGQLFMEVSTLSLWVGILFTILLVSFGGQVITLWVGRENFVGWPALWALAPFVLIQSIVMPGQVALLSINYHKHVTLLRGLEGLFNLALSLYLVRSWGVFGVAIATTVAGCATTLWAMPLLTIRVLNISLKSYIFRILPHLIFGLILLIISFYLTHYRMNYQSLPQIIFISILISSFYAFMYILVFAGPLQRSILIRFGKNLIDHTSRLVRL